jgi:hypothetical protein
MTGERLPVVQYDAVHAATSREEEVEAFNAVLIRFDALHFREKFGRQEERRQGIKTGQTFEVGERVGARFLVQQVETPDKKIDKTKLELLVEDGFSGDVRQSDVFVVDVSPDEWEVAQQFVGMPFNGVVEIAGEEKYLVSNMYRYPAKVHSLECAVPVNPENVGSLEKGLPVLVEGAITSFDVVEYWTYGDTPRPKKANMGIQTPDGRLINVQIDPNVKFEPSPALENIGREVPEVGDVVRITTTSTGETLYAPWCRSTYLLAPSEQRRTAFESLRSDIEGMLDTLTHEVQAGEYLAARGTIGKVIKQKITGSEREKLESLVAMLPDKERPLIHWKRYEADELNKAYGTDIDVMTREGFYESMQAAVQKLFTGTPINRAGDHSYLYRILQDIQMPAPECEKLMTLAAQTRWDYFKERNVEEFDHDSEWSDRYMLERSMVYLGWQAESVEAVNAYVSLASEIINSPWPREFFETRGSVKEFKRRIQESPELLNHVTDKASLLKLV